MAAVVQLAESAAGDADGLRVFVRERLAGFKVPRTIEFDDDMPFSGPAPHGVNGRSPPRIRGAGGPGCLTSALAAC